MTNYVWISVLVVFPYLVVCSIGVVVLPFIPPWNSDNGKKIQIGTYVYPAVAAGLLSVTAIYHALFFGFPKYSIARLASVQVAVKSMCHRWRHPFFGYKYRVFITPIGDPAISYMARMLRWCFGFTLDSPSARVDPDRATQVWLEQHGPEVPGCACYGLALEMQPLPPPAPVPTQPVAAQLPPAHLTPV